MNTLQRLQQEQGQSPWIDFVDRELIESGKLARLIDDGIRGLTSNPTIFAKAIASGQYDELIRRGLEAGNSNVELTEEGVNSFARSFDELIDSINSKRGAWSRA
ncbi:MAG: transaldolase family protein [Candidatus Limnocylindria bacterium]